MRTVALATLLLCPLAADAQETFIFVGPAGAPAWTNPSNWSGGSGSFSAWPGEAPQPGTRDSATITGSWATANTMDLGATSVALDVLRMGSSSVGETVIAGSGGATLTANRIEPAGGVFSSNRLTVDLLLDGSLELTNATSSLVLDGDLINGSPDAFQRTVTNNTDRTLSINGPVLLSDTPGAPGDLRFVNGGVSQVVLNGSISDGAAPGGRVIFARGDFDHVAPNTNTGVTQLGDNDPNVGSTHTIHTDTSLGLGRIVISGGNELKVIRSADGKGTRNLANEIQIARDVVFSGSNAIVLDGTVFQSNGRSVINQMSASTTLTFNGPIYASSTTDVREWTFDGVGRTVVNGVIDDSLTAPQLTGASVAKRGAGRTIFTNPAVAAYSGATRVIDGVLQIGAGGDAVGLNGDVVNGSATLEVNHSGSLDFDTLVAGSLTFRHTGPGVTTLSRNNTSTGPYVVTSGTLLVSGSAGAVTVSLAELGGTGSVGAVTAQNLGVIAPGLGGIGSLSAASLSLQRGGRLEIEIGSSSHDLLSVAGDVSLDGQLSLALAAFPADPLAELTVLTAGALSGSFSNIASGARLATVDGLGSYVVTVDTAAGELRLSDFESAVLPGDFNDDGSVDAADYTVWRDNFGQPVGMLPNDVDGVLEGGVVGSAQYDRWAANYGATAAVPASAIPEPAAAALAALAAVCVAHRPRAVECTI
ncbi:autotransporter-associated beta strand repeat-containing protein [Botrimarina mediterranea]|uniref:Autotransporter-associated beta strand repeat protein n=1 Tax=Botrimarina mediterranea TaxID=2528022 RepID=A0A518K4M5_9BACT|nr:autotransporter-associated beta strand repeat-containing protein [Botrimarina mediterranea]QDV72742.1 Autotransporter-associated beta strand repeat protein [Botrimarina mediterranea]QDV77316.1 Autotransporter-associated beta strand repeat protein [Planctomycetes bacterium K2D]